ncbi:unnamed protein product [Anisakis simplex]|uniref:Ovule protein n=1 Tax=Anisakis simplex TaxID=6269 RepID=A0A0M3KEH9_ANISI|nr:unnamed protein product [Anisakis simplex]
MGCVSFLSASVERSLSLLVAINPTSTPWNNFVWKPYTNSTAQYTVLDLPPRQAKGSLHWPVTNFWNKEAILLEEYTIKEKGTLANTDELTSEERLQVSNLNYPANTSLKHCSPIISKHY